MDLFTRQNLDTLLKVQEPTCISIYLQTHRKAPETQQDPIRMKNLLKQAEQQLNQRQVRSSQRDQLLGFVEELLEDRSFWQQQSDGLAIFTSSEHQQYFRLPRAFPEVVRISDHYYLNPLIPLLQSNGRFYLLAVSQNSCRLLSGDRDTIRELDDANLPKNLRSALGFWQEQELNFHSMQKKPSSRSGNDTAIYHGHYEDLTKQDLTAYFRNIDEGVTESLQGEKAPLVFAGVDYLYPLYRDVNHYQELCAQAVTGNPDDLSARDLHAKAWRVVSPIFDQRDEIVLSEFAERQSRQTATKDMDTIITAAEHGLVETLIIARDAQSWVQNTETGINTEDASALPSDRYDLLDQAVLNTLKSSGEVIAADSNALPENKLAVATLRAPVSAICDI